MKSTGAASHYLLLPLVLLALTAQGPEVVQAKYQESVRDQFHLSEANSRHHDVNLHCASYPHWKTADEGDVLHFHSPNYPRVYPYSTRCGWLFKGENEGIYFSISCEVFVMEGRKNGNCKDYLSIKDGSKTAENFCGRETPSLTTGHKVTMKFQTNFKKQAIGFTCTATAHLNQTWVADHPNIPERCNADPANVDKIDAEDMTALINNAKKRDIGCVRALIEANADVNIRGRGGVTALIMAARSGCDDCIKLLTDAGANIGAKCGRYGMTALMSACKNQQVGCVRNLISAGADVNQTTQPGGVAALAYASGFTCPECLQLLLDAGADPNNMDQWRKTALMAAARADCTSCMEKLLDAGAETDTRNDEGRTALIYSSRDGHPDGVRLLIDAGASVNIIDNENHNALWHARRWPCRHACIKLLKDAGAEGPDTNPQYCQDDVHT